MTEYFRAEYQRIQP